VELLLPSRALAVENEHEEPILTGHRRRRVVILGLVSSGEVFAILLLFAGKPRYSDPMVATAMTTSAAAFNARAVFTWKSDRQYRVYVEGEQLYFVRTGGQAMGHVMAHQFGLIGALIWLLLRKRQEKKAAEAMRELDAMHPSQVVGQHKHSFQVHASEITEQSLEPPSWYQPRGPCAARWRFVVRGTDRMVLELPTKDDVDAALRLLSPTMRAALRIEIDWNPAKGKFVRRGS
jgi:4-amino-4-deoxy-L-arabinose transferase-like glycosyltransferase